MVVNRGEKGFYTVKKRLIIFLSPGGMSLTKLSLAGNNLIFPGKEEFGK
jgi:hypothetical protein